MRRAFAFLLLLSICAPAVAFALHRKTPAAIQITQGSAGLLAHPRWGGYRYLVFDTNADLLGGGAIGNRQVYLFDLRERAVGGGPGLHRLTSGAGDHQRASTGRRGRLVIYDSLVNGVRQIFLVDRHSSGPPVALTNGTADSMNARISENERFAVFESAADLLDSNIPGTQIYRVDLHAASDSCPYPCPGNGNAGLTQITATPGDSHNAVTTRNGDRVAFESAADPLDIDENETQVYVAEAGSGALAAISHGPGASRNPTMSRNGRVAFESDADLLQNGTTGTQIFVVRDVGETPIQITAAPGAVSSAPSFAVNGRALTFVSNGDLAGNGSTGPEVFAYDLRRNALDQVTLGAGNRRDASYSAGVFLAFIGDGDLAGTGAMGEQLYFANLFALADDTLP